MRRGSGVRIGAGVDEEVVGAFRADDEALLAVQQEVIALVFRRRRRAEKIRSAARFGETFGGENVAPEQRLDITRLLLVGSMQHDGVADQIRADAEDAGEFVAQAADFLADGARSYPVQSFAAPLDRLAHAEQLAPSGLVQPLPRETYFVLVHVQDQLARRRIRKIARRIAGAALVFIQQMVEHVVPFV